MIEFIYDPMSEEEAQRERFKMLEDGIYKGVIEHTESKLSASGNPMGVFTLRVWDRDGNPKELKDYIPFIPSMIWKVRHLAESTGLIKEFEEKKFRPEICEGKNVMVKIKTQAGKEIPYDKLNGKEPGSMYPAKNVIDDYITTKTASQNNPSFEHANLPFDDVIPF